MSDLLTSLPGDIPGLLLRGSPVLIDFWRADLLDIDPDPDDNPKDYQCRGCVFAIEGQSMHVAWIGTEAKDGGADEIHRDWMTLDLTDATGRAHAAWWADERAPGTSAHEQRGVTSFMSIPERAAVARAQQRHPMTPAQIDTLARLVLRLAGR